MNIHSIAWKSILRLQQIYPKEVGEICSRIGLPEKILLNQHLTLPIEIFLIFSSIIILYIFFVCVFQMLNKYSDKNRN